MFVPVSPDASGFWICQKLWHHQCNSTGRRTWNKLKKLGKRYYFQCFALCFSFVVSFYLMISGFMCLIRRDLCVLIQPVSR